MNDKELADKVLQAFGIGFVIRWGGLNAMTNMFGLSDYAEKDAHGFVRDPRVAMALMEKYCGPECSPRDRIDLIGADQMGNFMVVIAGHSIVKNESLPRAIIEAWMEAQDGR